MPGELVPVFGGDQRFYTSLVKDTVEGRVALMKCMGEPDKRLKSSVNLSINVRDVFAHMVESVNDDTGEVGTFPRIILIDMDGTTYQCCSTGVQKDLSMLMWLYGMPPWQNGLRLTPYIVEIGNGRNVLKIKLADDEIAKQSTGKKR